MAGARTGSARRWSSAGSTGRWPRRRPDGDGPAEQAERAAALLRGRGADLRDEAGRAKALAYLARRGYDYEVAYQAVRLAERDPGAGTARWAA